MCWYNAILPVAACTYVCTYCRTKDLERKVKALKIKEQQEAKVLEAMVQKAEKNLTATTVKHCRLHWWYFSHPLTLSLLLQERAILAETQVSQLKKEILSLQVSLLKHSQQGTCLQGSI